MFAILERIGKVVYRLKLPNNTRIHPVFYVSQLRKALGNRVVTPMLLAMLTNEMEVLLYPKPVEGVREDTVGREVVIRWKEILDYEATWERWETLDHYFQEFHLADKVRVWVFRRRVMMRPEGLVGSTKDANQIDTEEFDSLVYLD